MKKCKDEKNKIILKLIAKCQCLSALWNVKQKKTNKKFP